MAYENPYMRQNEADALVLLLRPYRIICEVGLQEGRTAQYVLERLPRVTQWIGVDVGEGYRFGLPEQSAEKPKLAGHLCRDPRLTVWLRPRGSYDLTTDEVAHVEAAFIDGDHSYEAVANDIRLFDGVPFMAFHDYLNPGTPGVKVAIDEYVSRSGKTLHHVPDTRLCYVE